MIDKIKKIAAHIFECEVNDNTNQQNCEKWDSLHHLNLIVELETEFDMSFEPEEIGMMTSLHKVEEVLLGKLA